MLKFVARSAEGLPLKRKQSQRACETCRKRKKRCTHLEPIQFPEGSQPWQEIGSEDTVPDAPPSIVATPPIATTVGSRMRPTDSIRTIATGARRSDCQTIPIPSNHVATTFEATRADSDVGEGPHFIGDLNPEGVFLADASPANTIESGKDGAGIWLQRRALEEVAGRMLRLRPSNKFPSSLYIPNPLISRILLPHLEEECLRVLPMQADFEALRRIYDAEVQPLFPVLNTTKCRPSDAVSPVQVLIKQAICLAASTNPSAKSHLRLQSNDDGWTLRPQKEFAAQISLAMRTAVDLGLIKDEDTVLQVLALLSLFTQLSDDRHTSAELASRAVTHVHTAGLHLNTEKTKPDHELVTRVFCCVWALDRLNAAFNGRPVLMHERDFGRNLEECFQQQEPPFQLLLRVVLLLDRVIALYRPGRKDGSGGWETDFPSFEDLLDQSGTTRANAHLLATIEIMYHAVSMLTCRSQSFKDDIRSSVSYMRQTLSAAAIVNVVGTEFRGQLSLLPMVPYAVSLSLRFSYRELRLSKTPFVRARSRRQLLSTCALLRELGETFSASMLMVRLAEQTVQEMDKVFSSILQAQPDRPNQPGARSKSRNESASQQRDSTTTPSGADTPSTRPSGSRDAVLADDNVADDQLPYIDFDPEMFNLVPDLDIFDHFDPDFNLNAIDATLGENIAPTFPYAVCDYEP